MLKIFSPFCEPRYKFDEKMLPETPQSHDYHSLSVAPTPYNCYFYSSFVFFESLICYLIKRESNSETLKRQNLHLYTRDKLFSFGFELISSDMFILRKFTSLKPDFLSS